MFGAQGGRLSGTPPDYLRIAVPLLYQAGISVMGFFLSALVISTSLLVRDLKLMERIGAIMMEKVVLWRTGLDRSRQICKRRCKVKSS
ncbi:MAG: hypothetical protein LC647_13825 [Beggiatoa sp.]|nr:hypothetical protein [Beggiatoa sp.]